MVIEIETVVLVWVLIFEINVEYNMEKKCCSVMIGAENS